MRPEKKMEFLNPTVTVDVVIFTIEDGLLKALVITRAREPFAGCPALPGGFLHMGETSRSAAERILRDKAGVSDVFLEQLYTFDGSGRDPRGPVFSIAYFALVPPEKLIIQKSPGTEDPHLEPVRALPALAFDHASIVKYAMERAKSKLEYTNVAYSLLPERFALTDLQKVYEIILDKPLDKRNFRKKWKELGLVKATSSYSKGGRQRPARLYRFVSRKPSQLKKFF